MKIKLLKVALILTVFLLGMQLPSVEAATYNGETTVNLNIRTSPSLSGKVVETLPKGTKVKYGTYNQSWNKVYVNNRTYYASAQYIRKLSSTSSSLTTQSATSTGVTTANLNIRVSSSRSAKIVTTLKKGTEVKYAIHNSSWAKVYLNGKTYYAAKSYIESKKIEVSSNLSDGFTNQSTKLFGRTSQSSPILMTLPKNTTVLYKQYNSSWSTVHIGSKVYFTASLWLTSGEAPKESNQPIDGFANREVSLFGRTSQSSPVQLVLPKYTAVSYKAYNSSWSTVHIGSKVYYTASSWLTKGKAPAAPEDAPKGTVYINTPGDVLNVRSKASLDSNVVGQLSHGTTVSHYGTINGFHKIKFNGQDAFISSAFVMTSKPSTSTGTVIVLDPGHGGKDPGAVNGSLYEKTIVLDVTKRVEAYLRSKYDYNVRLTRSTDVYLTLDQRVAAAKSLRGDLFVSMHVNAAGSSSAKGVETFYSSQSAHSARSRVLASNIQSNLAGKMSGMSNRGVKTANYYVITYNTMPSALVELGFISSPTDLTYLRSNTSRQRMAEGVAEGIAKYVQTYY
ncbi:N-acetylmuramoyl-L-alanine amidase [Exiguobacterium profundum]|uniref:N-acetylmuramoyl-L-alanine amidase n=1 Tax=Exiguobacterium TaxID=33986 RepID=UPI001BABC4C6|nr:MULTISPECIES: N-acetylmuramoyl-L-alanine amidase [Exiguobacterium]MDX5979978.1 N-acetylmuramoyl-L-alanine amidase [Exiguobacterium profundum]QUP88073.1 N-acetylmuramoyl-L-alanine amidase [Exiguobacterium sp. PFWT01]